MQTIPDTSQDGNKNECSDLIHPRALQGLKLFNQGDYFLAHEALEDAWRAETQPIRSLYQGILQIGVAYYHILHGNYRGAIKLLRRGCKYLEDYPQNCRGIHVVQLRSDAYTVEQALERSGPERIAFFDHSLLKPIIFDSSAINNNEQDFPAH